VSILCLKRLYNSFVSREEAAMRRDTDPDYQLQRLSADLSNTAVWVEKLLITDPEIVGLAELADWLDDTAHLASSAASYAADLCHARESLKELGANHPSPDELGGAKQA
jgi:hypothetical protein